MCNIEKAMVTTITTPPASILQASRPRDAAGYINLSAAFSFASSFFLITLSKKLYSYKCTD